LARTIIAAAGATRGMVSAEKAGVLREAVRAHAEKAVEGVPVLVRECLVETASRESRRPAIDRRATVSRERPRFEKAHRQSAERHARHLREVESGLRRRPGQSDRRVPLGQNDPRERARLDSSSGLRTVMHCSRPIRRSNARLLNNWHRAALRRCGAPSQTSRRPRRQRVGP
jgi:hypothetical protein